jgi:hypothetical protein
VLDYSGIVGPLKGKKFMYVSISSSGSREGDVR